MTRKRVTLFLSLVLLLVQTPIFGRSSTDPWVAAAHRSKDEGIFILLIAKGTDYEGPDPDTQKVFAGYIKRHYGITAEVIFDKDVYKNNVTIFRAFYDGHMSDAATYETLKNMLAEPAAAYRKNHPEKVSPVR